MTSFFQVVPSQLPIVLNKRKTERHKLLLAPGMSAKMAANGIRTYAHTKQRRTLASIGN